MQLSHHCLCRPASMVVVVLSISGSLSAFAGTFCPPQSQEELREENQLALTAAEMVGLQLIQDDLGEDSRDLPYLSDIPILGHLFQQRAYDEVVQRYRQVGRTKALRELTFLLDEDNEAVSVLLNGLKVGDEFVRQTGLKVILETPMAGRLVQIELPEVTARLDGLLEREAKPPQKRIGISMEAVPAALASQLDVEVDECVLVASVVKDSPAQVAGLRVYDVIVKLDGEDGVTQARVREAVQSKSPDESLLIGVVRQAKRIDIEVTVESVSMPQTQSAMDLMEFRLPADPTGESPAIRSYVAHLALPKAGLATSPDENQRVQRAELLLDPVTITRDLALTSTPLTQRITTDVGAVTRNLLTSRLRGGEHPCLVVVPRLIDDQIQIETQLIYTLSDQDGGDDPDDGQDTVQQQLQAQIDALKEALARLEQIVRKGSQPDLR